MKPITAAWPVAALVLTAIVSAPGQTTFRSGVNLVRLQVLVTENGRPLQGLNAGDFEVTDNGVRQKVEAVFAEQLPLDVLFVVDRSASMAGGPMAHLKAAGHALLDDLRPEDRCGLLTFSHWISLDVDLTSDRSRVGRGLDALKADGLTSVLDALYGALHVGLNVDRRMLVLLFSDGLDSHSWVLPQEVSTLAQQAETMIAAVAFDSGRAPGQAASEGAPPDVDFLRSLATDTGGEVVVANHVGEFAQAFVGLIERARSRYLVTYYPQGPERAGWHEVKVKLRSRRGSVVVRRGYSLPAAEERRK